MIGLLIPGKDTTIHCSMEDALVEQKKCIGPSRLEENWRRDRSWCPNAPKGHRHYFNRGPGAKPPVCDKHNIQTVEFAKQDEVEKKTA